MGEQNDHLPSLDSTMALISSRRSIMPKDLNGEPLQRTEVKNFNDKDEYDHEFDCQDDDDDDILMMNQYIALHCITSLLHAKGPLQNADLDDYHHDDHDRLKSCSRQQIGLQLITGMNHGG